MLKKKLYMTASEIKLLHQCLFCSSDFHGFIWIYIYTYELKQPAFNIIATTRYLTSRLRYKETRERSFIGRHYVLRTLTLAHERSAIVGIMITAIKVIDAARRR